jgi:hypothetical protein
MRSIKNIIYLPIVLLLLNCSLQRNLTVPAKYNGKYGTINTRGKWLIKPTFDSLDSFYNGYADIYKNGKEGLINTKGKVILDCEYDFIGTVEDNRVLVMKDNSCNFSDLLGNLILKLPVADAEYFSEGFAAVKFNKNGKWGYIDIKGNLKIDTIFYLAYEFKKGIAEVTIESFDTIRGNENYTLLETQYIDYNIDQSGKIIDTIEYKQRKRKFPLIGYANANTLGRINSRGDTIMKPKYRSFGYVQEKYMRYYDGKKYGLADTTGLILIEPIYDELEYFSTNGLAAAKRNGKYGYINKSGTIVIDFVYDDARGFAYGLAPVKINGKWGFINRRGKLKIKPIYDHIAGHFKKPKTRGSNIYKFSDD